jgi:[ribosomal protein S5]-alanine N-acetyltransferase
LIVSSSGEIAGFTSPASRRASGSRVNVGARPPHAVATARLDLTPCSLAAARSSLQGPRQTAEVISVTVPETWPPRDLIDALTLYARELARDPGHLGWGPWLAVDRHTRSLVGSVGFKGRPDENACVEIGYGIEPACRRKGYASEAVPALLDWAWASGVRRVVAECRPDNVASIRVLEKSGMQRTPVLGSMLWWERCRPT